MQEGASGGSVDALAINKIQQGLKVTYENGGRRLAVVHFKTGRSHMPRGYIIFFVIRRYSVHCWAVHGPHPPILDLRLC